MNIHFGDMRPVRQNVDRLEYAVDMTVEDPETGRTEEGSLQIKMTAGFRPDLQEAGPSSDPEAGKPALSDEQFFQYLWYRIRDHVRENLRAGPPRVPPLRLRVIEPARKRKEEIIRFRESVMPSLPDFSIKENRTIEAWRE